MAARRDTMAEVEQRDLRVAMFSPVPPTRSGIAAYLVDLLPLLPPAWRIDVFTDPLSIADATLPRCEGAPPVCYAHTEFVGRHHGAPYDVIVYQVGNDTARAWMLDYALEHPGLLVLHDGVLHPARVEAATAAGDLHGYRRIADTCRGDVGRALGHLVAGGLGGPALYRTFPMCEDLVRASRVAAMHGSAACDWLRRQVADAEVVSLAHWRAVDHDRGRRDRWRERLVSTGEVLVGSFGNIGPERRLDRVLHALAELPAASRGSWRLVVAGRVVPELCLERLATDLGIDDRIVWHADLDDRDFIALMAAADVAVNLRYPPARASSGVLHQLLQLGVPTLISDVVHWRDYRDDAVARIPPGPEAAEDQALRSSLHRWIDDAVARAAASRAAHRWASDHITRAAMRSTYVEAVARTLDADRGHAAEGDPGADL